MGAVNALDKAIALARKCLAKKPPEKQTSEAFLALIKALHAPLLVDELRDYADVPERKRS